jgi:hypothetical protein
LVTDTNARGRAARQAAPRGRRGREVALVAGLVLVSGAVRWKGMRVWLWVDEGLSVGVASHDLTKLPGVLRQDGNPPLFYILLKAWMAVFGRSEVALHALSLVFALAMVPAAMWAGSTLFGKRAGLICASLVAVSPFLTVFSTEVRPFSLVALLSLVVVTAFLQGFALRRRAYLPVFVVGMVLLLYTHNWALYLVVAGLLALVPCAVWNRAPDRVLRDALLAFGAVGLLFLPWVPTLVDQASHTGAPWSQIPSVAVVVQDVLNVVGGSLAASAAMGVVMGAGLLRGSPRVRGATIVAVVGAALFLIVPVVAGFGSSLIEPNWASRYLAVVIGAAFLLAAVGWSRAGRVGAGLTVALAVAWIGPGSVFSPGPRPGLDHKTNVPRIAAAVRAYAGPGDLVVLIQPEQVAALHYYLPGRYPLATPLGIVGDRGVFDWRDAVARMRETSVRHDLKPLLDRLAPGRYLVLLQPAFRREPRDREWIRLIHDRSFEWRQALERDPRLRIVLTLGRPDVGKPKGPKLAAVVFEKDRD